MVLSSRLSCRPYRGIVVPFTSVLRTGEKRVTTYQLVIICRSISLLREVLWVPSFGDPRISVFTSTVEYSCPVSRIEPDASSLAPDIQTHGCSFDYHRRCLVHPSSVYDRPRVISVHARTAPAATGYPCLCKWPTLDVGQLCKGPRRTTVTTHRRHHYCHLPPAPVLVVSVCRITRRRQSAVTLDTSDFARNGQRPYRKGNVHLEQFFFIVKCILCFLSGPPTRLTSFSGNYDFFIIVL